MPAVKESVLLARLRKGAPPPHHPVKRAAFEDGRPLEIVDIRGELDEDGLKDDVLASMSPAEGPRTLPTLLLYDQAGLQLFEEITYLEEYYLTNHEIDILSKQAREIAKHIPSGSMVIELGSGNLRKVRLLLDAIDDLGREVDYYALDVSQDELERSLACVTPFRHVTCRGVRGTYDDGREWLKEAAVVGRPKCILHLGSSIGNFQRDEAAEFLASFAEVLQDTDTMLLGIDSCNNPNKVYHAYNDSQGITHRFILNGLAHANELLGEEAFQLEDWKVIGEYVYDEDGGRHQAFVAPTRETVVLGSIITPHERIRIEQSLKYSRSGVDKLWRMAGLNEVGYWTRNDDYGLHLLQKSKLPFSGLPALYASDTLPTMQDWQSLWQVWDIATRKMLPDQELNEKPIKLRNACIFYLGHIPTFLDIQLTKTTGDAASEPKYFHRIFERGVDPDVDNPEKCHDHSEIPDEWPPVETILIYQDVVRERLANLYADAEKMRDGNVRRAIFVGFEHEILHLETLLYMLLQSDKTLPPPHTEAPDFEKMALKAREARVENEWFDVPEQTVVVGLDDPEDDASVDRHFGWDNEKPSREEKVHKFQAKGRAITNEEYAEYLYKFNVSSIPASWSQINRDQDGATTDSDSDASDSPRRPKTKTGKASSERFPDSFLRNKYVRTVYGPVPLKLALDWPVFASYDELAGCARWMGGRIPTAEEARSIYAYVEKQKKIAFQSKLSNRVPAVNGHLVNDGVEETPPSTLSTAFEVDTTSSATPELFVDLTSANVGFKHWHPLPVTHAGGSLAGRSGLGGVWEWTSSVLEPHPGFSPMALYPAYTADFFDGKHNVVLGGSWATHPRVAGRASFVNWYQRNYPYAWAGARLVRDM